MRLWRLGQKKKERKKLEMGGASGRFEKKTRSIPAAAEARERGSLGEKEREREEVPISSPSFSGVEPQHSSALPLRRGARALSR